jgi:hypothetical protein
MQITKRKSINHNLNIRIVENAFQLPVRKKRSDPVSLSSKSFDQVIVDIVSAEYPDSNEEASVLTSKIWNLIEAEIFGTINEPVSKEKTSEKISMVSELFNKAVVKLKQLNLPLLKYGAVNDYFMG